MPHTPSPSQTPTPPDPRRVQQISLPPGVSAVDLQQAFFELAAEEQGLRGGALGGGQQTAGGAPTRQTMNEFIRSIPPEEVTRDGINAREAWIRQFNAWAGANRIAPDFDSAGLFSQFQADTGGFDTANGGGGRVQFESERALDVATALLREEQARTEASQRAALAEQTRSEAMSRVSTMFDLLQTTDQLADARRQIAVQSLIQAAPFLAPPGAEFSPGFEPGGLGEVLGNLLGANVPNQMLPTAELPLNELANPQLAAPPSAIAESLDPFLAPVANGAGTPQMLF